MAAVTGWWEELNTAEVSPDTYPSQWLYPTESPGEVILADNT